jgi:hypothetical protein
MQIERFKASLVDLGVFDIVDKMKQISAEIAGLPGYQSLLSGCLVGLPTRTFVSAQISIACMCVRGGGEVGGGGRRGKERLSPCIPTVQLPESDLVPS